MNKKVDGDVVFMTFDARQKCGNLRYAITYNVIWANYKTESFEYHWLRALAKFDMTSFPTILLSIGRHFKLCQYDNLIILNFLPFD